MATAAAGGFLARLNATDAAALVALGRSRTYPPKSVLFFEGDDAHEVLIVRSGQVKVSAYGIDGREVVLDVLGPEDILGELSAIDGAQRSATKDKCSGPYRGLALQAWLSPSFLVPNDPTLDEWSTMTDGNAATSIWG